MIALGASSASFSTGRRGELRIRGMAGKRFGRFSLLAAPTVIADAFDSVLLDVWLPFRFSVDERELRDLVDDLRDPPAVLVDFEGGCSADVEADGDADVGVSKYGELGVDGAKGPSSGTSLRLRIEVISSSVSSVAASTMDGGGRVARLIKLTKRSGFDPRGSESPIISRTNFKL